MLWGWEKCESPIVKCLLKKNRIIKMRKRKMLLKDSV
nr:MAG TPA: hypothetical protein [Caudoviricetes sp.]